MHNSCTFIFNINKNILLIIPCLKMYYFVFLFVCFLSQRYMVNMRIAFHLFVFFSSSQLNPLYHCKSLHLLFKRGSRSSAYSLHFATSVCVLSSSDGHVCLCLPLCDGARCQSGNQHSERLAVLPQQPFLFLHATLKPDLFSLRRHTHLSLRLSIPPAAC